MSRVLGWLRIRPVWVSLLGAVLTLLSAFGWQWLMPGESRRGLWVAFGVLLIWALIEWGIYLSRYARERLSRRGQLRIQLDGAFRNLVRECSTGNGTLRSDVAVGLPWLLLIGSPGSGKSRFAERAGFRRIATCGTAEQPALCVLWLSQDAGAPSVCVELAGGISTDSESAEQVYLWLRGHRSAPDAIVLQVSLDDLGGSTTENAVAMAVQLSPLLRSALAFFPRDELPVHVVLNKCDRIEGLSSFFPASERRPWGFRIDRPLHSELPADLLGARLAGLVQALWQHLNGVLSESQGRAEVEALLDFPREVERQLVPLGAFLVKLCEQFTPDTRARLVEVFLLSAGPGASRPHEAARHRRIPGPGPRPTAAVTEGGRTVYFVSGAVARMLAQVDFHASTRAPRQSRAVWAAAIFCMFGVFAMSRWFQQRQEPLRQLTTGLGALSASAKRLEGLHDRDIIPNLMPPQDSLAGFLTVDQEFARARQQVDRTESERRLSSATGALLAKLSESAARLRQCESAGHLVAPLVSFNKVLLAHNPGRQPLYESLKRFSVRDNPKRKNYPGNFAAREELTDRNAVAEWLESVYALVMIQRSNPQCSSKEGLKGAHSILARQFTSLWLPKVAFSAGADRCATASGTDPTAGLLCRRLDELFSQYLKDPHDCEGLRRPIQSSPLGEAQQQLARYSDPNSSGGDSIDMYGGIMFTLRALEVTEQGQFKATPPSGLKFLAAPPPLFPEYTLSACARIMHATGERSSRLSCLLSGDALNATLSAEQGRRLGLYFSQRNAEVWSSYLEQVRRRTRSAPAVNPLDELGNDIPNLLSDLPILFRYVGAGEKVAERLDDRCRDAVRPFAPLLWATDQEDEGTGKSEAVNVTKAWQAYQRNLGQLKELLAPLAQSAPPSAQSVKAIRGSLDKVREVVAARRLWMDELKAQLKPPVRGDALARLEGVLRDFEVEAIAVLFKKASQNISCRVGQVKNELTAQLPAAGTPHDAAYQQLVMQANQALRQQVGELRQLFDNFSESPAQCQMRSFDERGEHRAPLSEACSALKSVPLGNAPAQPPPPPQEPKSYPPSLIPIPNMQLCLNAVITWVTLDLPEAGKRYRCNLSRSRCSDDGPAQERRVTLRFERIDRTTAMQISKSSLRALLATPSPAAPADPWLRGATQKRSSFELSLASECKASGLMLQMYFDEDFVHRYLGGGREPEFLKPTVLDGVLSKLEACP